MHKFRSSWILGSICVQVWPDIQLCLYISGYTLRGYVICSFGHRYWCVKMIIFWGIRQCVNSGPAGYWVHCVCRSGWRYSFTCILVGSLILLGYGYSNWRHWVGRTFTFGQICSVMNALFSLSLFPIGLPIISTISLCFSFASWLSSYASLLPYGLFYI